MGVTPSTPNAPLRPSVAVRASTSSDGLILLDERGGLVFASNQVGALIWELIEQRSTPHAIVRRLVTEYGVADERATVDVAAFVGALAARGLIAQDAQP
jgi:coenzyme PQQ synthesis protein D (PqqD)